MSMDDKVLSNEGQFMTLHSSIQQMVRFSVTGFRQTEEAEIVCGFRRLDPDESPDAEYVIVMNAQADAAVEYQIGVHLQTENYDPSTTRVVGIILGEAGLIKVYRVGPNGELEFDRSIEAPILFVEVAGPNASATERTQFDDQILLYEPEEVRAEREKREQRPWWKFW